MAGTHVGGGEGQADRFAGDVEGAAGGGSVAGLHEVESAPSSISKKGEAARFR